ncbi:MAG TPA: hypothetical protein VGZ25_02015 [Gemmataceae bacterium]|nr:hypothetical protein [Gemmataceae bacterium]
MSRYTLHSVTIGIILLPFPLVFYTGCSSKPTEVDLEQRVREKIAGSSPDWKDITYRRNNAGVVFVTATRSPGKKTYEFSLAGGFGDGFGVSFRLPGNDWLGKYEFKDGKKNNSEKMKGTDDDMKAVEPLAAELAGVVERAGT